ncbi:MAG: hypothetical protein ACI8R4_001754 [Paracoccaceae bacterium]|jgi:hypothetical protein
MRDADFIEIGERLTKALITGDFDLYRSVMDLPLRIEPRGGKPYTMDTIEALQQDFGLYIQAVRARGITDIYRQLHDLSPVVNDTCKATCLMHILEGATLVVEPFLMVMTLRKTNEGWRFCRIQSPLGHINWSLGQALISDDGRFDDTGAAFDLSKPKIPPNGGL